MANGIRMTWTETFVADVTLARLVELFEQYVPGKAAELLAENLADNAATDSDYWPILRTIRYEYDAERNDSTDDVSDVSYEEID